MDITMSLKEANRATIMDQLQSKKIKQAEAAKFLNLSTRQVRRLLKRYQQQGVAGLVHKGRGKTSNRKIPQSEIDRAISLVRTHYFDFGPTLAHEKLVINHGVSFGVDVLRQAMIDEQIWRTKKRKKPRIHQLRERRPCEGELVQLDGSPHDWFEGRGGLLPCTLLNAVDDATSKIKHAKFALSENLNDYFVFVDEYFNLNGKPVAWYLDKHAVFRNTWTHQGQAGIDDSHSPTQFARAMHELGVELIYAHTPQAKGRVERSNRTLQDRLVKEMRLRGITSIKAANDYLPVFIAEYNHKFAVAPKQQTNRHRRLAPYEKLGQILVSKQDRTLSKNLTCQYHNLTYQIQTNRPSYAMRHARVQVHEDPKGQVEIYYKGKLLKHTVIKKQTKSQTVDHKQINVKVDQLVHKNISTKQNLWDRATAQAWDEHFYA